MTDYVFKQMLEVPAPITALYFSKGGYLLAGAGDGTLRVYPGHVSSPKVMKAIRGLNAEVSSVYSVQSKEQTFGKVWIAAGRKAHLFSLEEPGPIFSLSSSLVALDLGEDDEDDVNALVVNRNGTQLAFCTDSGAVGVVDLANSKVTRMRTRHANVCGTVKFIPDRPNELLSGGYDCALIHHDLQRGGILSRHDIAPPAPHSGVSLSPPFIISLCVSQSGVIAAGTADGHVWLGGAGEKHPPESRQKKRSRKWEGLTEDESITMKVAEGPIVALEFSDLNILVACTLLGSVTLYNLLRDSSGQIIGTSAVMTKNSENVAKVNAMAVEGSLIAVGGLDGSGRGVIELWEKVD